MTIDRGWIDDEVVIVLGGDEVYRCKSYTVKCSVFTQPAAFQLRLGEPTIAAELRSKYKMGDAFQLRLQRPDPSGPPGQYELDVPLQSGALDAVDIPETDETVIELRGRDNMAALFDSFFVQDDSVTEATFYDMTAKQLKAVGFDPPEDWLFTGETGRKKAVSNLGGVQRKSAEPVRLGVTTVEHLDYAYKWIAVSGERSDLVKISAPSAADASVDATGVVTEDVTGGQPKQQLNVLRAEVGQQRYGWLKSHYKKIGLFLWCIPDGRFALSRPNGTQEPAFRLQRRLNGFVGENNILSGGLRDDSVQRYSHTLVYGRAGGGKDGRRKIVGEYVDQDLIDAGITKQISYKEPDCKTQKAADYLAKRYAADARRASRSLVYTVAGHSSPSLIKPGARWPFWVNSVVHVLDEKLGIDGNYYVGDVELSRAPQTKTRLTLYWTDDLIFAEDAA